MSLLNRLRHETRVAHERIEAELDLPQRLASLASYRRLIERLYGFHVVWESAAAPVIADPAFFDERRKAALLSRDLTALGHSATSMAKLPVCEAVSARASRLETFGAFYVLEGSTLGGNLIAKDVARRLGLDAATGCAYFRCYGTRLGAMWTVFRDRLEAVAAEGRHDVVIASAMRTYEDLRAWLQGEASPAR